MISIYELSTLKTLYDHSTKENNTQIPSVNFIITFIIGLFILFNLLLNMFYTIYTDASIFSINKKLPAILLKDWKYCSICEVNCPPRSYHCHICNKCVLKRLNHCMFLGKCCGYANARYYFLFLIYTWLATVYCNFLNAEYIIDLMHGFSLKTIFVTIMPMLAWVFGIVDNIRVLTVFVNTTCLLSFFILFFYLILNLKLIQTGQTWFEKANNIHSFKSNRNLKANIIDIFGSNWYFTFFCPFIRHRLPGDGTHFTVQKYDEELKSI